MRYGLSLPQTSVSVAVDLLELLLPTAKSGRMARVELYSKKTASEKLRLDLLRVTGAPTSGSGGSTATPRGTSTLFSDPSLTAEIFNTTQLSGGTAVSLWNSKIWDLSVPFIWVPGDELDKYSAEGATRFVLRLLDAPAAATNMMGVVDIDVIG